MKVSRSLSFPPFSFFCSNSRTLYSVTNFARLVAWVRVALKIPLILSGNLANDQLCLVAGGSRILAESSRLVGEKEGHHQGMREP